MLKDENCVEIIADKLYWFSDQKPPSKVKNALFFCVDEVNTNSGSHL